VTLMALLGLAVTHAGLAQANSLEQTARRRFCQFAESLSSAQGQPNPPRRNSMIENRERRSLATLISLKEPFVRIESRSRDWKSDEEALARVLEVVASKPGFVTPGPGWSEMVVPGVRGVVATLDESRKMKMEIAGFHVCVQDSSGQVWFFRTVPVDGWIR